MAAVLCASGVLRSSSDEAFDERGLECDAQLELARHANGLSEGTAVSHVSSASSKSCVRVSAPPPSSLPPS